MNKNTIDTAELHYKFACDYMKLGAFEIAVDELTKAIELEPENEYYHDKLGIAYAEMEDYESSQKAFRKALEINKNFAPSYCNLGMCLYRNGGRIEETIELYNKAIALEPEISIFYFNRGLAYFDSGNEELALQNYTYALKLDNRLTEAYSFRAEIYIQKKMWKEASADLRKIIRIEGKVKTEDKNG